MQSDHKYDVALSFAGEDRDYVARVAASLQRSGVRVFYDEHEKVTLWGRDLYVHLQEVYRKASRYTVMFISQHYARKLWTNHERQAAQARALVEHTEYILPVRLDETEIPGILPTVGYVDIRTMAPEDLAGLVLEKLGVSGHVAEGKKAGLPREAVLDLIMHLQSRDDVSLATCVAEGLALATQHNVPELAQFCAKELVEYPTPLSLPELESLTHRHMRTYCTAGEIDVSALSYRNWSVFDCINSNRDHFVEKVFCISEPVATIEAKKASNTKGSWVITRSLADFDPAAGNGDAKVTCYSRYDAYERIADAIRVELTRRLTQRLSPPNVTA